MKILKLLSICAKFQVNINSSSLSKKKYDGDKFPLTPCKGLRDQSMLLGTGLIELTGPSHTLDGKRFSKHCILQFKLIFSAYICVKQNLLFQKVSCIFKFFGFDLGWHSTLQYQSFCVSGALFIRL